MPKLNSLEDLGKHFGEGNKLPLKKDDATEVVLAEGAGVLSTPESLVTKAYENLGQMLTEAQPQTQSEDASAPKLRGLSKAKAQAIARSGVENMSPDEQIRHHLFEKLDAMGSIRMSDGKVLKASEVRNNIDGSIAQLTSPEFKKEISEDEQVAAARGLLDALPNDEGIANDTADLFKAKGISLGKAKVSSEPEKTQAQAIVQENTDSLSETEQIRQRLFNKIDAMGSLQYDGLKIPADEAKDIIDEDLKRFTSPEFIANFPDTAKRVQRIRQLLDRTENKHDVANDLASLFRSKGITLQKIDIPAQPEAKKSEGEETSVKAEAPARPEKVKLSESEQIRQRLFNKIDAMGVLPFGDEKEGKTATAAEVKAFVSENVARLKSPEFFAEHPNILDRTKYATDLIKSVPVKYGISNDFKLLFESEGVVVEEKDIPDDERTSALKDALDKRPKPSKPEAQPYIVPVASVEAQQQPPQQKAQPEKTARTPEELAEARRQSINARFFHELDQPGSVRLMNGKEIKARSLSASIHAAMGYFKSDAFIKAMPPADREAYVRKQLLQFETENGLLLKDLTKLFEAEGILTPQIASAPTKSEVQSAQPSATPKSAQAVTPPVAPPSSPPAPAPAPASQPTAPVQPAPNVVSSSGANQAPKIPQRPVVPTQPTSPKKKTMPPNLKVEKAAPIETENAEQAIAQDKKFASFLTRFPDGESADALSPEKLEERYETYKQMNEVMDELVELSSGKVAEGLKGFKLDATRKAALEDLIEKKAVEEGGAEKFKGVFAAVDTYKKLDAEYADLTSKLGVRLGMRVPQGSLDSSGDVIKMVNEVIAKQKENLDANRAAEERYGEYADNPNMNIFPSVVNFFQKLGGKTRRIEALKSHLSSTTLPADFRARYEQELKDLTVTDRLIETKNEVKVSGRLSILNNYFFEPGRVEAKMKEIQEQGEALVRTLNDSQGLVDKIKQIEDQYSAIKGSVLEGLVGNEELAQLANDQLIDVVRDLSENGTSLDALKEEAMRMEHIEDENNQGEFLEAMRAELEKTGGEKARPMLEARTKDLVTNLVNEQMKDKNWSRGGYDKLVDFVKKHTETEDDRLGAMTGKEVAAFITEKLVEHINDKTVAPEKRVQLRVIIGKHKKNKNLS